MTKCDGKWVIESVRCPAYMRCIPSIQFANKSKITLFLGIVPDRAAAHTLLKVDGGRVKCIELSQFPYFDSEKLNIDPAAPASTSNAHVSPTETLLIHVKGLRD